MKKKPTIQNNQAIEYSDQNIIKVEAFEKTADTLALDMVNGMHCYAILYLNNKKLFIQRVQDRFFIKKFDNYLLKKFQKVKSLAFQYCNPKSVNSLRNELNEVHAGRKYHIENNNCYDFIQSLFRILGCSQESCRKILKRKQQILIYAKTTIVNGCHKFLVQAVDKTDDIYFAVSTAKTLGATGTTASKTIASSIKTLSEANVIGTIACETITQLIQMKKNDFKEEAVIKGVANIGVGTASSIGGFMGGAELGAAIGIIGGPPGAAIGGLIGGVVGSIGGSWLGKKLMPWNWN